jgi:uncharacterized membrane protein
MLVLIRPAVDNLYFLKEVSPLISPPYIVGVITPVLCVVAMLRYKFPASTSIERSYIGWSVMLCLAALLVLVQDPLSLLSIEFVLKLSMPVYLFFFLRIFIRDLRDLHGILTSFLYAAAIVAGILLYEVIINPISLEESRGLQRIQGSFGDVVSYGMYVVFSTAIAAYFYFSRQHVVQRSKLITLLAVVGLLSLVALLNIHHTATYAIFIMLFGLFFLFNLRHRNLGLGIALIAIACLGLTLFGTALISEKISPLIETDLAVYQGEKDTDQLLHGRVGRWRLMLNNFFAEPIHVQFFGLPMKFEPAFPYIGIGSHNDFFRIFFATGFVGIYFYLSFLWQLFRLLGTLAAAQRFLLYGVLITLLLYSISVTPTFYAPFLYFALSIFAFVLLPDNQRNTWNGRQY